MKICKCDFCETTIVLDMTDKLAHTDGHSGGISFEIPGVGQFDLCNVCLKYVRRAMCHACGGRGTVRVRDDHASESQASCGESRSVYKTVRCEECE